MNKNILVYYQHSLRAIFFESFIQVLLDKGYNVYFLTKGDRGLLHDNIEKLGAKVDYYNPKGARFFRFFYHIRFLIKYCRKNKIDVVYSHLQLANLVALLAQYFIKAKVIPCRHHVDEIQIVGNKTAIRIDKMVNRLSKKIVVVSNAVKRQMVNHEKVKADKIFVIPLGYDFNLYSKPDSCAVAKIKEQLNCHFTLILIARMTKNKRHILALEAFNKMVKDGMDVKILILDRGPEQENLESFLKENGLAERATFTGFLNNTMDYVAAADLLVHPSIIEASNQVVREVGLAEVPVVVCDNVGDFNEYIYEKKNGFIVSQDNTANEMYAIVKEFYNKKDELKQMGKAHKEIVLSRFNIQGVTEQYLSLAN